jgi:hypothetical protein
MDDGLQQLTQLECRTARLEAARDDALLIEERRGEW